MDIVRDMAGRAKALPRLRPGDAAGERLPEGMRETLPGPGIVLTTSGGAVRSTLNRC